MPSQLETGNLSIPPNLVTYPLFMSLQAIRRTTRTTARSTAATFAPASIGMSH